MSENVVPMLLEIQQLGAVLTVLFHAHHSVEEPFPDNTACPSPDAGLYPVLG